MMNGADTLNMSYYDYIATRQNWAAFNRVDDEPAPLTAEEFDAMLAESESVDWYEAAAVPMAGDA
jgi:hypothetical protein